MSQFEFGLGVADITPVPGILLWGYSNRSGPATGVLDPLYSKAMVFRVGEHTAAWVSLDLGRPPMAAQRSVIQHAAREMGVQHIALHATHTHHAPGLEVMDGAHHEAMTKGIIESIALGVAALQPARWGFARADIDIAHNRRILTPGGACLMLWRNEDRRPTAPVDREAVILKIDDASGHPLAIAVHFACHPVILGPSNLDYSGDFAGEMARIVKGVTGTECVFLQGGCGDINPYLDKTSMDRGGLDAMHASGRIAAESVMRELGRLETRSPVAPSVQMSESMIEVGVRWNLSDPEERALVEASHPDLFNFYMQELGKTLAVPLAVLVLNGELALAGMPGEIFVEHQLRLKQLSTIRHALLCGYVDDFHGYIPPIEHAAAGGYGGMAGSYVGIGAADLLMARAQEEIFRLKGRIKGCYTSQDFAVRDYESPGREREHVPGVKEE